MEFPVDLVYTWVDSQDEAWFKRKSEHIAKTVSKLAVDGIDKSRFRNNDELKYSLRSIEKYAPWVRKIFIVTDRQQPKWLNIKNKKIEIVDHRDIFPDQSYLPTYNSMAIEACIHRIKDLSEHYLYFNDDFILGNYCSRSTFFSSDGKPFIYTNYRDVPFIKQVLQKKGVRLFEQNTHHASMGNSRYLIYKKNGIFVKCRLSHGIKPFLKSSCANFESHLFAGEIDKTMKSRFRDNENILMSALFSYYTLAAGIGIQRILYTPGPFIKFITKSQYEKWHVYIPANKKNVSRGLAKIKKYKPFQYCINDMPGTDEKTLQLVNEFYEHILPEKSAFEL
jgi:hypothetical protein